MDKCLVNTVVHHQFTRLERLLLEKVFIDIVNNLHLLEQMTNSLRLQKEIGDKKNGDSGPFTWLNSDITVYDRMMYVDLWNSGFSFFFYLCVHYMSHDLLLGFFCNCFCVFYVKLRAKILQKKKSKKKNRSKLTF